jgi:O-antigen/teichoic acid export membrane protein
LPTDTIDEATTVAPPAPSTPVARRAVLLAAAQAVSFAITFALPVVLVRVLSPTAFGVYKQAFQVVTTAICLLNLQVAISAIYFMAREPGKKLQVALNIVLFYAGVGALTAAAFSLYPRWVVWVFNSDELVPHVPLLGLVILLGLVSACGETVAIAVEDFRFASAYIVLSQLSKSALLLSAGLMWKSVGAIVAAAAVQGMLLCGVLLWYLRRRFGRWLAPIDRPLFAAQMRNAIPFGIGGFPAVLQADLHNYFVSHFFNAATFAVYSVGCMQLPLLGMLTAAFSTALAPEVARRQHGVDYQGILHVWADVVRKLALVLFPAFALLFVLRREFIVLLFTETYSGAVPIFAINLFAVLLSVSAHYPVLRAFDELKYFRLKLYLGLLPFTWAALHWGVRYGGLVGAVTASVLAQTLDVAISVGTVARKLGASRRDWRHFAALLRIGAAAAAAAIVVSLLKAPLAAWPEAMRLVMGVAAFGPAYAAAVLLAGAITDDEKVQVRRALLTYGHRLHAQLVGRRA